MTTESLGEKLTAWAARKSSVHLLVLIGSHARGSGSLAAADPSSDWDFQIATSQPDMFGSGAWLSALGLNPLAYILRTGRLGSSKKATAVTEMGELDLVVIPTKPLLALAKLVQAGQSNGHPQALQALTDLSAVLAGGYRIMKGAQKFAGLYDFVVREIPPARIGNVAVCNLAEGFVCDYVFACRKIMRGELLAVQRWLHHQLAQVNFSLLHELRLRHGKLSFPDARRLERLDDPLVEEVKITALPTEEGLRTAVEKAAATHRILVAALVGDAWRWPDLSSLHLRAE